MQSILTTGLITSLLAELDSSDILLRLNVIELLSTLAGSPHGLEYLQGKGIIDKLHHQLASVNEDPLGNLVVPGNYKSIKLLIVFLYITNLLWSNRPHAIKDLILLRNDELSQLK